MEETTYEAIDSSIVEAVTAVCQEKLGPQKDIKITGVVTASLDMSDFVIVTLPFHAKTQVSKELVDEKLASSVKNAVSQLCAHYFKYKSVAKFKGFLVITFDELGALVVLLDDMNKKFQRDYQDLSRKPSMQPLPTMPKLRTLLNTGEEPEDFSPSKSKVAPSKKKTLPSKRKMEEPVKDTVHEAVNDGGSLYKETVDEEIPGDHDDVKEGSEVMPSKDAEPVFVDTLVLEAEDGVAPIPEEDAPIQVYTHIVVEDTSVNMAPEDEEQNQQDTEKVEKTLFVSVKQETNKEGFVCSHCGRIYKSHRILARHIKANHSVARGTTEGDGAVPATDRDLNEPSSKKIKKQRKGQGGSDKVKTLKEKQGDQKPGKTKGQKVVPKCTYCEYVAPNMSKLKIHIMRRHTKEKNHKCDICEKAFGLPWELKMHREIHFRPPKTKSEPNKIQKVSSESSKIQEMSSESGKFDCSVCGHVFIRRDKLRLHIKQVHLPRKCPSCSLTLPDGEAYRLHKSKCCIFKCNWCSKLFQSKKVLERHISRHPGRILYTCSVCHKAFRHKLSFKVHTARHRGERNHECKTCGKKFYQLSHLNGHKRVHTQERNFVCEICGHASQFKGALKKHKLTHEEPQYSCKFCEKRFKKAESLSFHMRIHTGQDLRQCPLCYKKFTDKRTLQRHLKNVHERRGHTVPEDIDNLPAADMANAEAKMNEAPKGMQQCPICFHMYTSKLTLRRHLKNIHGQTILVQARGQDTNKWQCSLCSKYFKSEKTLKGHIRNVHKHKEQLVAGDAESNERVSVDVENKKKVSADLENREMSGVGREGFTVYRVLQDNGQVVEVIEVVQANTTHGQMPRAAAT